MNNIRCFPKYIGKTEEYLGKIWLRTQMLFGA
jgi:hypothetical protein